MLIRHAFTKCAFLKKKKKGGQENEAIGEP